VSVSNGTTTTQYVYDGSGGRVKRIVGNTTTLYVAGMEIEKVSGTETQCTVYYPAGGAFRIIVASPSSNTLYYRHSDHLGSTSVLSDSTGAKVSGSEVVFAPFGETRASTSLPALTDIGYTDFDDAFVPLAHWLEVEHMTERIHSALGYLTPAEFEAQAGFTQPNPLLLQA